MKVLRRILLWGGGIPALAMILGLGAVGVIIYGYVSRAGGVGVSGYLELLSVPVAIATGGYLLDQAQRQQRRLERILLWGGGILTLALAVGIAVILYIPKTFWDYLALLIVPVALTISTYLLARTQRQRRLESESVQEARARVAEEAEQSRWRPTGSQVLGFVGILVILGWLIHSGYAYEWTGFGQTEVNNDAKPSKTLWDWLKLLIVPAVLAIGGYLFTRSENRATQVAAERRAQDDTLQAYLDGMAQLLTDEERPLHSAQPGDSLSTVARARTLTVLSRLDGGRKRSVLEFLYESRLIDQEQALINESDLIERRPNIVSLEQAALSEALLIGAALRGADLKGADLRDANLREANLRDADLSETNLRGAYLRGADLSHADLRGANLSGSVGLTDKQIAAAESLDYATMPNGRKYEDWLKSRENDRKNSGPS